MKALVNKMTSILVLVGLLASGFALAFSTNTVAAQGPQPPAGATKEEAKARITALLERQIQAEQRLLEAQAKHLKGADNRVQKIEERIAGLKEQGKDTTALEEALASFRKELKDAHTKHVEAEALLNAHPGFDANGKVSDVAQARESVREAGRLLREVRQDLRPAVRELLRAVRAYIRDNRAP